MRLAAPTVIFLAVKCYQYETITAIINYYNNKSRMSLTNRPRTSILDRPLSRGKGEVSLSCFALLFSEVVQYCQNKVYTVPELQNKYESNDKSLLYNLRILIFCRLHELGRNVGVKIIDLYFMRERNGKREIKLLNMLLFIKSTLWKVILDCVG